MFVIGTKMTRTALLAAVAVLFAGCATPDAPDFRGRWKPLNQFSETPQAIPLHQGYVYQASPVDGTLKGMLSRWAKDSKLGLSYLHPNDYTLHASAARVRTYDLRAAAAELSAAYAGQGVRVSVEGAQIVVAQAGGGATDEAGRPAAAD